MKKDSSKLQLAKVKMKPLNLEAKIFGSNAKCGYCNEDFNGKKVKEINTHFKQIHGSNEKLTMNHILDAGIGYADVNTLNMILGGKKIAKKDSK